MDEPKRNATLTPSEVQQGNAAWWNANTMSYDWNDRAKSERSTPEWFDEIDGRFVHGARLFATEKYPFDRLIPFDELRGKRVLEIGCGMGFHTELMARRGALVTSIDISPTSVDATRTRLQLKKLPGSVALGDAEKLPFPDADFDFVWSWGVIHHSSRTGRIVREIARVLRPQGACRVMVYNRDGMAARVTFLRDHLLRGGFLRGSFDETLYRQTDGFSARFYVREHFEDLFRTFFNDVSSFVCGQDADVVPLPRQIRRWIMPLVGEGYARNAQARRGAFLVISAGQPAA